MGWALAALLGILVFTALAFALKVPRGGWEAIGAALLFGVAGYGLQGRPTLPGTPTAPAERAGADPAALVAERRALAGGGAPLSDNRFIITADALARHGQYGDAAGVLLGAVDADPSDAEAWTALGNALVGHAEGALDPAALYAFRRAAAADPAAPGPPYFLGLALAESGRFDEARALWARLLAASPPDAPWHMDLTEKLRRLDLLIAARRHAQALDAGRTAP